MKVDIVGRHARINPGFCGVMALYEARHLSSFGHDVELVLPFHTRSELKKLLSIRKVASLESLLGEDDAFEIRALYLDEDPSLRNSDALIWQSTDPEDWKKLYSIAKANCQVISKNFPKMVRGLPAKLSAHCVAQMNTFDLLAMALKEDYHALWQYPEFAKTHQHKFRYVQRGADPIVLNNKNKSVTPLIAIDTPNTSDNVGIEHLIEPLLRLKEIFPDLRVITLGGATINLDFATGLPFMPFEEMYRKFLNPAWIYCVVDYSQSPAHIKGSIHEEDRTWDAKAIYEVQTIEAQMAGCVIAGYKKNIIPELVEPSQTILWNDFSNAETITESLREAIENHDSLSEKIRERALRQFSWEIAMRNWEDGLLNLTDNGYDRDKKTYTTNSLLHGPRHIQPRNSSKGMINVEAALSPDEKQLLHTVTDSCRRFVEFGCGGSTKIAALSGVDHIESIETDSAWIKNMAQDTTLSLEIANKRLRFHHIDIGETKEWGYPEKLDKDMCVRYTKAPWTAFPLDDVDAVLVDGRFRVATTLEAALRTQNHCLVLVDDYLDRTHYSILEEHLDIEIRASRMVVFTKGSKWRREKAFNTLEEYRFDPR